MNLLKPHVVIHHFDISEGMHVADLSADAGFFAHLLSEKVGPYGKVHVMSENEDLIRRLISDAESSGRKNILHFTEDSVGGWDRALISKELLNSEYKPILFGHAFKNLKPGGKLILIQRNPLEDLTEFIRIMILQTELEGFVFERDFHAGDFHSGLIFKRI